MRKAENVNAPNLWGWGIGAAAGLVAFGVLVIVGKFDLFPAAFLGAGVAALVGLILGMPWGAEVSVPARPHAVAPGAEPVETATAQPIAAPFAAPAAAPVAEPVVEAMTEPLPPPVVEQEAAPVAEPVETATAQPIAAAFVASTAAPVAEPVVEAMTEPLAPPVVEQKAAPVAEPLAVAAPIAAMPVHEASAGPVRLSGPRGGAGDDLKEIEGIGPALEKLVNSLGFYHFDQIANWSEADVAVVDAEMKTFKGRITRDRWVAQAKLIVAEGLEAFRERAKTNNY
jgi:predicted flap endonuclease-1-like 5' DNA nuclease